jgi:predicted DNA-binding transcriptional regulator AlpA
MIPIMLRFNDLKAKQVVNNWPTLLNWIKHEGFPPGRKIGPNTRAWTEDEVNAWLATRPLAV